MKNPLFGIDVAVSLLHDAYPVIGRNYQGTLRLELLPDEYRTDKRLVFEEKRPASPVKRNRHLFQGQYITLTCRPDGSPRLNFRQLRITEPSFSLDYYCIKVACEIRLALREFCKSVNVGG